MNCANQQSVLFGLVLGADAGGKFVHLFLLSLALAHAQALRLALLQHLIGLQLLAQGVEEVAQHLWQWAHPPVKPDKAAKAAATPPPDEASEPGEA